MLKKLLLRLKWGIFDRIQYAVRASDRPRSFGDDALWWGLGGWVELGLVELVVGRCFGD